MCTYQLSSKSPLKKKIRVILHEMYIVINVLIINFPECVEVKWLPHYRTINIVLKKVKSVLMAVSIFTKEEPIQYRSVARKRNITKNKNIFNFYYLSHMMNEMNYEHTLSP